MLFAVLLLLACLGDALAASPGQCVNFRPTTITEDSATLFWDNPENGTPSTGFLVHCRPTGAPTWQRLAGRFFFDHEVSYPSLESNTDYECRCRAWSSGETKPKSEPVFTFFKTALPPSARTGVPGNPTNVVATEVTDSSVRFDWTAPVDGGIATGYAVEWRTGADRDNWGSWTTLASVNAPQPETSAEFTGLNAGWVVMIKVKSINAEGAQASGEGKWQIATVHETAPVAPRPPPIPTPPPIPGAAFLLFAEAVYSTPDSIFMNPIYLRNSPNFIWTCDFREGPGLCVLPVNQDSDGVVNTMAMSLAFNGGVALEDPSVVIGVNVNGSNDRRSFDETMVAMCDLVDDANPICDNERLVVFGDGFSGEMDQLASTVNRLFTLAGRQSPNSVVREYSLSGNTLQLERTITLDNAKGHGFAGGSGPDFDVGRNFAITNENTILIGDGGNCVGSYDPTDAKASWAEYDMNGVYVEDRVAPHLPSSEGITFNYKTGQYISGNVCQLADSYTSIPTFIINGGGSDRAWIAVPI